ncbi:MAG TPA: D-aminoacylase [Chloroflexota bacterium]|nr:D-aminoacylase [Chloroflexota bacterium]
MSTSDRIDVLIRGGRVVDGTGNPWFYGDVGLAGERISAIARPGAVPVEWANMVVDAQGMVVCPGFIDIQSHSILPLMRDRRCLSKITQGVTTEIMGEGWTPAPSGGRTAESTADSDISPAPAEWADKMQEWRRFRDWLEAMEARGVSPNIGSFLGSGTLRAYVKGMDMAPTTTEERTAMRAVVEDAMRGGAFGLATALIYPPDAYHTAEEVIDFCKVVSHYGGLYITHMRSEADQLLEGLDEALTIGREANLPVEIYHLKAAGRHNWHKMPAAIARINAARAEGLDVTCDMYPYTAGGTSLMAIVPPWVSADGKFFDNLRDPATRARIRREVLHPTGGWEPLGTHAGPDGILPLGFHKPELQAHAGKRLSEIAAGRGQDWLDCAFDLLLEEGQGIGTLFFLMSEENIRLQLAQPWMKISTDAGGVDPAWAAALGPTHPRAYGTYTSVLGRYVREEGIITLEDAIRKMSGAVATRLGIWDRGLLREGMFADVVILDPDTVAARATYEQPHQLSVGIRDVWVNGARVLEHGVHTGAAPGKIVSGPGAS